MIALQPRVSAADVRQKLPLEREHLEAQQQMHLLEPYYRWTLSLLAPHLGRRVMDAGCGIGNFTELLARRADYVLAVDLSPRNVEVLERRFAGSGNVEVLQANLEHDLAAVRSRQIDTAVCLDVLEHVEDDVALLASFRQAVRPGGTLLLKVPACRWLYGSIDVASSHCRRYAKGELVAKARQAGWQSACVFYMNVFGVLPYWLKSRVFRRSANFSRTFPRWQIDLIRRAVPLLQAVDGLLGPPIGQSAILVAR